MKFLFALMAVTSAVCLAGEKPRGTFVPVVPPSDIIDTTLLKRQNRDQIEVIVVNFAGRQLTFQVDRKPIAKITDRYGLRLFLAPGRYRFGIVPSYQIPLTSPWEMYAEVTRDTPQRYRFFPSSGFTSSGGNMVYEIARF